MTAAQCYFKTAQELWQALEEQALSSPSQPPDTWPKGFTGSERGGGCVRLKASGLQGFGAQGLGLVWRSVVEEPRGTHPLGELGRLDFCFCT